MKRMQKGFTLIELMIVVAIIGILAAVAIPAYQDYVVKAKLSKVTTVVDPIKLAIASYYQEQGMFVKAAGVSGTSGLGWASLGLSAAPSVTTEAPIIGMTACTTCQGNDPNNPGAAADPNIIQVTLDNIRAGTINGTVLSLTPNTGSTAITWSATCNTFVAPPSGTAAPTVADAIVKKYFGC